MKDVEAFVKKMADEWGVLSIHDVVWNHAAKNAPWLQVCQFLSARVFFHCFFFFFF